MNFIAGVFMLLVMTVFGSLMLFVLSMEEDHWRRGTHR